MKPIKSMLLFLGKNFLTGFIIMLWALVALLGVQAFQSLTTNPSDSGNQSLGSPILSKNGWTFNRDVHSLEAIAKFIMWWANNYKRVFVTSTVHNGNLGWVTGADTICQNAANSWSLWGNWTAFLSDSTSNFITRYGIDNTKYLYTNLLWQPIFTSWFSGFFQNEWLKRSVADFLVYNNLTNEAWVGTPDPLYWTSTNALGILIDWNHCTNWTTTSGNWWRWYNNPDVMIDGVGNPSLGYASYFYYYGSLACVSTSRLLCIEK